MISRGAVPAGQDNVSNIINELRSFLNVIFRCFEVIGKLLKGNLRAARERSCHIQPPRWPGKRRAAVHRATAAGIDQPIGSPNR